jgi:hypothetical protein
MHFYYLCTIEAVVSLYSCIQMASWQEPRGPDFNNCRISTITGNKSRKVNFLAKTTPLIHRLKTRISHLRLFCSPFHPYSVSSISKNFIYRQPLTESRVLVPIEI